MTAQSSVTSQPSVAVPSSDGSALVPWALAGLHSAVQFCLTADASPGLLPRLLQPFAKRDLTPDSFRTSRRGDSLVVDIAMAVMPAEMVHLVEGNLRQTVGVRSLTLRQETTGSVRRCAA